MKKFTTGILATLACFACFATACSDDTPTTPMPQGPTAVETAATMLKAKYNEDLEDGRVDYTVSNVWGEYDVTWTVSFADGTNAVSLFDEGDFTTVEINKLLSTNVDYTLTATLKAADGSTASTNIIRTATPVAQEIFAKISSAPVSNTAYKLHMYHATNNADYYFTGAMDGYYFKTSTSKDKGVDIYVEDNTDTSDVTNDFYMYFADANNAEVKHYLYIIKSGSYTNVKFTDDTNDKDDDNLDKRTAWTYDATVGTMVTNVGGTNYYLGTDSSKTYKTFSACSDADDFKGGLATLMNRADVAESSHVSTTLAETTLDPVVVGEYTMKLPLLGDVYPEASIAWSVVDGASAVSLNERGNRLTTNPVTELTTVKVKATVSSGNVSQEKELSFTVAPNTVDGIFAATASSILAKGASFANEVTLKGMITTDLPVEPSTGNYANINNSITIEVAEGKKINAYRLAGAGYDVVKPGYNVEVKGIITNYNGTVQFAQGCEIVSYEAPTDGQVKVDVEKALFDMETSVTKDGVVALPTAGKTYSDVAISWAVVTEGTTGTYTMSDDKTSIEFTLSEAGATVVNLQATLTCGSATETINVAMNIAQKLLAGQVNESVVFSTVYTDDTAIVKNAAVAVGANTSISFDYTGTQPKYYKNGTAIRIYSQTTMTISCTSGSIVSVALTMDSANNTLKENKNATDVYDESDWTITGATLSGSGDNLTLTATADADTITIAFPGGSGNCRLQAIAIIYNTTPSAE